MDRARSAFMCPAPSSRIEWSSAMWGIVGLVREESSSSILECCDFFVSGSRDATFATFRVVVA